MPRIQVERLFETPSSLGPHALRLANDSLEVVRLGVGRVLCEHTAAKDIRRFQAAVIGCLLCGLQDPRTVLLACAAGTNVGVPASAA